MLALAPPLHHAYVVLGNGARVLPLLKLELEKILGRPLVGYPDYHYLAAVVFTIDDSRELRESQTRLGLSEQPKIFIVSCEQITREAQNALLKTFEEPTKNTHLFLIVPSERSLLPTLLSRVQMIKPVTDSDQDKELIKLTREFLEGGIEARLKLIERIIGSDHPDRAKARAFVGVLAREWRQAHEPDHWSKEDQFVAAELNRCHDYLHDPAALAKMILEHLALIL